MPHRWKARITPPRFLSPEEVEGDGKFFEEKMQRLVAQSAESAKQEQPIRANLKALGYAA